ncbi:molybdopterin molybdenumtransferase MoeA [Sphingomonas changnyeongensis]|uniref:Molybdopterin molybdenumtransferase n=1 Tax=Sphingomonas changnyeongensis TaxID=2698679 RepID=A0A7Z2NXP9_9SPHN|nr:gephyrin-like molybdotransferase Glp [Sphingomonas changnyeongensis]QHL91300.1 molybdopterin molybdenumtransferase MoeA [Sphingomonas changnyeongensis]
MTPAPSLLPVSEAQARLIAVAPLLPPALLPLAEAAGRWAAEDVVARVDHPFADLSAMDGYAIRHADLPGPWQVTATIAAGRMPAAPIGPGMAARIFTGAPLPAGADTILVQEDARRDGDRLTLAGDGPDRRGAHVRRRAMNFAAGDTLIPAGARIAPARIGLAALGGHAVLPVRGRARIALLSTGDELAAPGAPLRPGQIHAANAAMIAAQLAALPVMVSDCGIIADDRAALARAIADAAAQADILVTIGGASVGDHDLVQPALADCGATLDFWRIAMRPGKPLMAGQLSATMVLGLPGNPVSAFVTSALFLMPLIAAMGGATAPLPPTLSLPLGEALPAVGPRADYLRGRVADGRVFPVGVQDSGVLTGLARADALIIRPAHAPALPAGAFADVHIIA